MLERATRLLRQLASPADPDALESFACAAWRGAVGKRIGKHARAERLVRTRLIVGVDDAIWQRQLFTMKSMILAKLQTHAGPGLVTELEFRVSPPKRQPSRAQAAVPGQTGLFDEAAHIADPGLRRLYVVSRKRELA